MMGNSRHLQGKFGEDQAAQYLAQQGCKILERNYRYERGEIDLIVEDGEELVFVEVKARRSTVFGSPEDAVTEEKQQQIYSVAEGYVYEHNVHHRPCRFDVIAIDIQNGRMELRHIRDAF